MDELHRSFRIVKAHTAKTTADDLRTVKSCFLARKPSKPISQEIKQQSPSKNNVFWRSFSTMHASSHSMLNDNTIYLSQITSRLFNKVQTFYIFSRCLTSCENICHSRNSM